MRYLIPSIITIVGIVAIMFNTVSISEFDIEEDWTWLIPMAIFLLYGLYEIYLLSGVAINSEPEDEENQNNDKVEEKKEEEKEK